MHKNNRQQSTNMSEYVRRQLWQLVLRQHAISTQRKLSFSLFYTSYNTRLDGVPLSLHHLLHQIYRKRFRFGHILRQCARSL